MTWTSLEGITQSERSQMEEDTYSDLTTREFQNSQHHRTGEQRSACQGLGVGEMERFWSRPQAFGYKINNLWGSDRQYNETG